MIDKVKAGLRGLSAPEKAARALGVYDAMNGNPHFPAPEPTMAELRTAIDELMTANVDALDRGLLACARKRSAVQRMDLVLSRLAAYVNSMCQGDLLKLGSSGFPMAKRPEPISAMDTPVPGANYPHRFPGRVELRWNSIKGALVYEVEIAEVSDLTEPQWRRVGLTSRPRIVLKDLTPGSKQMLRVCAVGAHTDSGFSSPRIVTVAA